jgi:hypothetical protein
MSAKPGCNVSTGKLSGSRSSSEERNATLTALDEIRYQVQIVIRAKGGQ